MKGVPCSHSPASHPVGQVTPLSPRADIDCVIPSKQESIQESLGASPGCPVSRDTLLDTPVA